jgi:hypothetical protein
MSGDSENTAESCFSTCRLEDINTIIACGLALKESASPFARLSQDLLIFLAKRIDAAQLKYLQDNRLLTPVGEASSERSGPPQILRNALVRQASVVHNPRAQRSLFAQPPPREGPGQQ